MQLLNAMAVIYATLFQKRTTVKKIRDADLQAFGDDHEMHMAFRAAWQALPDFCKSLAFIAWGIQPH